MRVLSYLFIIVIIVLGLSFAGLNSTPVHINYYIGEAELPLSLLLVLALSAGALIGLLFGLSLFLRMKCNNLQLRRRIKSAEKEVDNLRAIPIKDVH